MKLEIDVYRRPGPLEFQQAFEVIEIWTQAQDTDARSINL